jgi:cytochrome c oxidase subunit II
MPDPISPLAQASVDLFNLSLAISTVIVLFVAGLVLYMIPRFRSRGSGEPRQDFGNRKLEIAWTIVPFVLLAIVLGFALPSMGQQEVETSKAGGPSLQPDVVVTGRQWWWEVRYPASGVAAANEIHLPVGKRILVELVGGDVIHDLWIPQLGPKMDAVPGQPNWLWLQAQQPGTYQGVCAEYCGTEHAWMLVRAIAMAPAEYTAWLTANTQPATAPTGGNAARGAQLFTQRTCISCHAIAGTAAQALAGPNLTHVASRQILAAGVLENNPENMARWLRNPQEVKPGNHMPNVRLSEDEVRDLTAYMETLR